MSDKDRILGCLRRVARRLNLRSIIAGMIVGLALTAACAGILAFAAKLTPIPHVPWITLGFLAFGALAGALLAPRASLREAAIRADLAAGTDEVLSSALEADEGDRFGAAVVSQASAVVKRVPVERLAGRGSFAWAGRLLTAPAALALLLLLPGLPGPRPVSRTAEVGVEKLRRLEKQAREIKNLGVEIESKELAHLSQQMQKLAHDVRDGKMDRKEALAKLAQLAEKSEAAKKDLGTQQKSLAELGKNADTKSMADALSRGDTAEAKKAADALAGKLAGGELSKESKGGLREMLSKMASDSKGAGEETSKAAGQASEALDKGDSGSFGRQMSKLAESMKSGARAGARSGRSGKVGKQGGGENDGPSELDDAQDALSDAQDDLEGEGESSARTQEHCDTCGRKQNSPGG